MAARSLPHVRSPPKHAFLLATNSLKKMALFPNGCDVSNSQIEEFLLELFNFQTFNE